MRVHWWHPVFPVGRWNSNITTNQLPTALLGTTGYLQARWRGKMWSRHWWMMLLTKKNGWLLGGVKESRLRTPKSKETWKISKQQKNETIKLSTWSQTIQLLSSMGWRSAVNLDSKKAKRTSRRVKLVLLKTILYHFITTTFQKKKRIHGCFFYVNLQQGAAVPIKLWPGLLLKKNTCFRYLPIGFSKKLSARKIRFQWIFLHLPTLWGVGGAFCSALVMPEAKPATYEILGEMAVAKGWLESAELLNCCLSSWVWVNLLPWFSLFRGMHIF